MEEESFCSTLSLLFIDLLQGILTSMHKIFLKHYGKLLSPNRIVFSSYIWYIFLLNKSDHPHVSPNDVRPTANKPSREENCFSDDPYFSTSVFTPKLIRTWRQNSFFHFSDSLRYLSFNKMTHLEIIFIDDGVDCLIDLSVRNVDLATSLLLS